MALRSLPFIDDKVWQLSRMPRSDKLADELRASFTAHRPHFLDSIKLNETAPESALTFYQWAQPATFTSLMAIYSDHIYRHHPRQPREGKPLKSLWAQWYIGLLVPPLVMALLTQHTGFNLSPEHIQVQFHETGRAATFWIEVEEDASVTALPLRQRLETLIIQGLMPVVNALEASGDVSVKLIWSNTGYLLNWFFGEISSLLDEQTLGELRQACFLEQQFSNGQENPLWRSVIPREGLLVRRTCCQRYKLPDVQRCGDCTLKK